MKLNIPQVIETYIKASNEVDLETTLKCFNETATVLDNGESLSGQHEISEWFKRYQSQFTSTALPIGIEDKGDTTVLKAKVTGNFPGSPIVLDFNFKIKNGLIEDLRIS